MGNKFDIVAEYTNQKALSDTTGLKIGKMFKEITGSNELLLETMYAIGDDNERLQGMVGTLLNLLYQYVSNNGNDTGNWKVLVDHLCSMLDIPSPE